MKTTKVLYATTAALALSAGAAMAGDNNEAYTSQLGNENLLIIQQGAGPGSNRVGTQAAPILQQGDKNEFRETQSTGGGFSRGSNVINAGVQDGEQNNFSSNYSNNAGGNLIDSVTQDGNRNNASVGRNNSVNGSIDTILQQGDSNFLAISQSRGGSNSTVGNTIGTVEQIGSNNGWSIQPPGNDGSRRGTVITQRGAGNNIDLSSIEGSNNNRNGEKAAHQIVQFGFDNGQLASTAKTLGSNGNWIHVRQDGSRNNFNLQQGVNTASQGNDISVVQIGDDNRAGGDQQGDFNLLTLTQDGNGNGVDSKQYGSSNDIIVTINGNDNGLGRPAVPGGLVSGLVEQFGNDNYVSLTIAGNLNAFGLRQGLQATAGFDNRITGLMTGDSNIASVAQTGSNNTANFAQIGDSNSVTITQ